MAGEFTLTHLEYRQEFDGKRYGELPRPMQRRISETQLVVNVSGDFRMAIAGRGPHLWDRRVPQTLPPRRARIHLRFDARARESEIGYIGVHLPL